MIGTPPPPEVCPSFDGIYGCIPASVNFQLVSSVGSVLVSNGFTDLDPSGGGLLASMQRSRCFSQLRWVAYRISDELMILMRRCLVQLFWLERVCFLRRGRKVLLLLQMGPVRPSTTLRWASKCCRMPQPVTSWYGSSLLGQSRSSGFPTEFQDPG
jgi:hypothetical protein